MVSWIHRARSQRINSYSALPTQPQPNPFHVQLRLYLHSDHRVMFMQVVLMGFSSLVPRPTLSSSQSLTVWLHVGRHYLISLIFCHALETTRAYSV
jgi:hypothetical protein